MAELQKKINMWRLALEERNANLGVMQVFDSMLVFMGEQQREIEQLKRDKMMFAKIATADFKPAKKDHPYGKVNSGKLIL